MQRVAAAAIAFVLFLPLTLPPAGLAEPTRAELERQQADLKRTNEALEKDSEQTVNQILQAVNPYIDAKRKTLETAVKNWREDGQGPGSERGIADWKPEREDLQRRTQEALGVAKANGLDVDRLTRIFEQTKKVIRTADFSIPVVARNRSEDPTLEGRVSQTFLGAEEDDRMLDRALQQNHEYRWGLYKKVTEAYIHALLASQTPPAECRTAISGYATLGGQKVPVLNCPDAVVDHLRAYLNAVRTIQSADTDSLASDVALLIGEQQFKVDVVSIIPQVAEAMSIYSALWGEDLVGNELGLLERGLLGAMVLVPRLGPPAVEYAAKKSARVKAAIQTMALYISALSEFTEWYARELKAASIEIAYDVTDRAAKNWGMTRPQLLEAAEWLKSYLPDAKDQLVRDALRDAAFGRISLLSLPAAERQRVLEEAAKLVTENLGVLQGGSLKERIAKSGIVAKHADGILAVAQRREEIYIFRSINADAAELIEELNLPTKPMPVKAKSATLRPIAALIPTEQELNKVGSELMDARRRLAAAHSAGQSIEVINVAREIEQLEAQVAKGKDVVKKCFASNPPCAIKVPVPLNMDGEKRLLHYATNEVGEPLFMVEDGRGGWVNAETRKPVVPREPPRQVLVFGDPKTGKPYTADYDLLNRGGRETRTGPGFDERRGFTTATDREAIEALNEEIRMQGFEGGDMVHHGAEQFNPATPGVDYPVTAFEPNGNVVHIAECDLDCMKRWCATPPSRCRPEEVGKAIAVDKDRLLKDYFHLKRIPPPGFNLDPNPKWGWGPYNGLSGWLPVPVGP